MAGISGRQVNAAYSRSNTWGVPASVTQQILIQSTAGLENQPMLIDDPAFGQDFIGVPEVGDMPPITPTIPMLLRFEQGCDTWMAGAMGSAAAPSVVSSVAANSLVAYSHVLTLASVLGHQFTLAVDHGGQLVSETRTFKTRGFTIKVGSNGVMAIDFPIVGDKTVYDSTVNTTATVNGAAVATPGNRALRKNVTLRMNAQAAGTLGASDALAVAREFQLSYSRPLAQGDYPFNSDSIMDPDDDGQAEFELQVTHARMNTVSANSLVAAFPLGTAFKADITCLGTYINTTTRRSILIEMPALFVSKFDMPVAGHGLVRPVVTFKGKMADAAPSGMTALTNPMRVTIINARSTNLLA